MGEYEVGFIGQFLGFRIIFHVNLKLKSDFWVRMNSRDST